MTICDPACGSGAFLNQALNFLIDEHKYIDELQAQLFGSSIVFEDVNTHILENNLYGVDINEESVDIAKLSLWLRTAKKGRKLSNLSSNIKCGNSLISDIEVAGDRAFDWEKEFPEVFENGGFDIVIGNPPYVRVEYISEKDVEFYKEHFLSSSGKFDLSSLFFEKSIALLNSNGLYSIITSYQFIYSSSGIGLRKFIAENTKCSVIMFSSDSQVFEGATTYTGIFIAERQYSDEISILKANNNNQQINITKEFKIFSDNFKLKKVIVADTSLLVKLESHSDALKGSSIGMAKTGVVTSADEVFFLTNDLVKKYSIEKELVYPIIGSSELNRWILNEPKTLCLYPYEEKENKTSLIPFIDLEKNYNGVYSYLQLNKEKLIARSQGRKDYSESDRWYQLNRPREKWIYDSQKFIYPGTTNKPKFAIDEKGQVFRNARVYAFLLRKEYNSYYKALMPILNSSLTSYLIRLKCPPKANDYYEMSTGFMESYPFILPQDKVKQDFEELAEKMIYLSKEFQIISNKFSEMLKSDFTLNKLSKKLNDWYLLEWAEFEKELKKIKVILLGIQKDDWHDRFNRLKEKALSIKLQIDKADIEIDEMVYELYGLNQEEIRLIENEIK